MPTPTQLLGDPWLRGSAVVGVAMAGVTTIVGLPWPLWFAWAYVVALSTYEALTERRPR